MIWRAAESCTQHVFAVRHAQSLRSLPPILYAKDGISLERNQTGSGLAPVRHCREPAVIFLFRSETGSNRFGYTRDPVPLRTGTSHGSRFPGGGNPQLVPSFDHVSFIPSFPFLADKGLMSVPQSQTQRNMSQSYRWQRPG